MFCVLGKALVLRMSIGGFTRPSLEVNGSDCGSDPPDGPWPCPPGRQLCLRSEDTRGQSRRFLFPDQAGSHLATRSALRGVVQNGRFL